MFLYPRFLNFIFLFVLALPATALAEEKQPSMGEKLLDRFLTESEYMSADFNQTLRADDNEVLQESKGHFYLHRPDKFRWNYAAPYQQEIVSNGKLLWVYDVDLQQVTVQEQSASTSSTPMALMQGKVKLQQAYDVTELDYRDGIYRLKLTSKSKDVDFSEVIVGVDEEGMRFIQLRDQFEQMTDIVFGPLELDKVTDEELFEFTPPEGVDVYGGS